MWRPYVYEIALFLLPFLVYGIWLVLVRKMDPTRLSSWREAPIVVLVVAAAIVTTIGLVAVGHFGKGPAGAGYQPARLENGKLIPPEIK